MTSSTNKISIPKKIFENLFFKEGGTKEQLFKELTGEYQFSLDEEDSEEEPNAEIEGGEYIFDSRGVRKAEGNSHERGGMPVKLEEGTKIISDHLKVGAEAAKRIEKMLDLPIRPNDTYATVIDKYNKKSGLDEINDKLEEFMGIMKKQKDSVKDKNTSNLNLDFLNKKLYDLAQKKKPIEKEREQLFNVIFQIQEMTKKQEDEEEYEKANGGQIASLAAKYGISPQRAAELAGLPQYQIGGKRKTIKKKPKVITGEKQTAQGENTFSTRKREKQHAGTEVYGDVESAQASLQQLYRNFPDLVNSGETLKNNIEVDNRGNLKFKGDIKLNKEQKAIGSLQQKMNTRMVNSAQNIINNPGFYGDEAVKQAQDYLTNQTFNDKELARGFDSKLGQFSSGRYSLGMNLATPEDKKFLNDNGIFNLRQLKDSPLRSKLSPDTLRNITDVEKQIGTTDADYAINQFSLKEGEEEEEEEVVDSEVAPFTGGRREKVMGVLGLPQRPFSMPNLRPSTKIDTKISQIDPAFISPNQAISEIDRAASNIDFSGMTPQQEAFAKLQTLGNQTAAINKEITGANRYNAQAQNAADIYNAKARDTQDLYRGQNALSYEQRELTGLDNFDNDYQNMLNQGFRDQTNNFKTVEMYNYNNAINPNVQFTGNGYEVQYDPNLSGVQDNTRFVQNQYEPDTTKKSKAKAKTKNPASKFGGRFKKK